MKKIIFVVNTGFTIINFRKELVSDFIAKDFEVLVLCPKDCSLTYGGELSVKLADMGVKFIPIDISRQGLNPLSDLKLFFSLFQIYRKEKPSVILNYTIKPIIYSSIAARLCGVKKILSTVTGLGYIFTDNSIKAKLIQFIVRLQYFIAFKCNRTIFFQNPDDLELCKSKGLLGSVNTKIINGSGVNLGHFKKSDIKKEKDSFLLIARMLKDKGIFEYIEAATKIKKKYPHVQFYLLGPIDSNPTAFTKSEIDSWVDDGIINYIPAQSDVRPYLSFSEVFVLPSYREGTPRSVLEAMAMEMPVITTNAPGCKETVEDGCNGFLVDVKNSEQLANSMEKFILDKNLASKMGSEGLKIAQEKYDVTKVNQSILAKILD
jgi:glycosyltransferase involved in cell wall biosynthesis